MEFWDDLDMVLPPGEVFDHRGMFGVGVYVLAYFVF
jgi:hypothetical protein